MLLNFSDVVAGGFLTKDAVVNEVNDKNICRTTLAINYRSIPGKKIKKVTFIEIVIENKNTKIGSTLKKGDYVIVKGQLKQKIYEKDGYNFVKTYLVVDKILNVTRKQNKQEKESETENKQ